MPHASDAEQLLALHARLSEALQRSDWRALAETDQAIRQCLEGQGEAAGLDAAAAQARLRLQQLHRQALAACAEECERLHRLLLNHREGAEGRAAYQRIGLLQAGARG